MKGKKPSVFANEIKKDLHNNNKVYYSSQKNEKTLIRGKNINEKITNIFNSPNYVYKADVDIILVNGKISKRVIGKNNTHLITIDNELIPITDIIDIYYSK